MIEESYVTLETSKLLCIAGFPQDYIMGYTTAPRPDKEIESTALPTQAQAMRWLRDDKRLIVTPDYKYDGAWCVKLMSQKYNLYKVFDNIEDYYPTYEVALEVGIKAACKYLIEQNEKRYEEE